MNEPRGVGSARRAGRTARRTARRSRRAPLAPREGLDPVRWRVPAGTDGDARTVLASRFPPLLDPGATPLADRFAAGEIVRADGTAWTAADRVRAGEEFWFHRELRPEQVPDVELPVLLHDEHLLVVDKPPGMATMPRGEHILASALVRLRRSTGCHDLSPLHRLDRATAGVLLFGVRSEERAAYQELFARREVHKTYRALVDLTEVASGSLWRTGKRFVLRDRLEKRRGELRTRVVPGEPDAITAVHVLEERAGPTRLLELHPRTGRTHQLRAQLAAAGAPIRGDELYPVPREVPAPEGDLHLLALSVCFTDPVTGEVRELVSRRDPRLGT